MSVKYWLTVLASCRSVVEMVPSGFARWVIRFCLALFRIAWWKKEVFLSSAVDQFFLYLCR